MMGFEADINRKYFKRHQKKRSTGPRDHSAEELRKVLGAEAAHARNHLNF
jgi:hypothetical protein